MTKISEYLDARYQGRLCALAERDFVERVCHRHIECGFADANFVENLCSGSETKYWQALSEALFGCELVEARLHVEPSRPAGPDFLIVHQGRKIRREKRVYECLPCKDSVTFVIKVP
jgi:hypothetical protein